MKAFRHGRIRKVGFALLILLSAFLLVQGCSAKDDQPERPVGETSAGKHPYTLRLYSGAGLRPPVDELATLFEKEHKARVQRVYGGASLLLGQIKLTGTGDLLMPGDVAYIEQAEKEGLILEKRNVCYFEPVILVAKGNPKHITSVKDLLRPDVRLGLGDPRVVPIGRKSLKIFEKNGISEKAVQEHLRYSAVTVNALGDAVKLGTIDAAIVWDAVAAQYPRDTEVVKIPPERNVISTVAVGILKSTKHLELAQQFANLLTSERARSIFKKHGYATEHPAPKLTGSLFLYCGAGIRPPVAELVELFQKQHEVKIETMYSGSNLLLGQIKLSHKGDLYMPGDMHYVEQAEKEGLIQSKKKVAYFIPVILVQKGNPKKIQTLEDLLKPGVKLGLGNPEACAIGRKTMKIFAKNRIDQKAVDKNVVFLSVTVNELGTAIKLGTVDATIVWDGTAAYYAADAEVVKIPPERNIISTIPIAVLSFSKNQALANRLVEFITSDLGKETFKKHGYTVAGPQQRLHVFFSGRVQRVGFRASTQGLARRFKVTGFVRNLPDGRVEMVAEGDLEEVKAFLAALKELRKRNIEKTEENWLSATGEFKGFTRRY